MVKEPTYKLDKINNVIEKLIKNKLDSKKLSKIKKSFLIGEKLVINYMFFLL